MAEKTFPLERFYYGKFQGGDPKKRPNVLARTSGITAEQVKECLLVARLAPPTLEQASDKMAASIGIFRGEKLDFVLTVAQLNSDNVPQLLFVILPKGPMSWLAGNLQPFRSLSNLEMPLFTSPRDNLTPFVLKEPKPAPSSQQAKVMSNYLFYAQDNMNIAEGILTGIINGKSLAVVNAPNNIDKRLNFIEGLSALLPPPIRINLTFATNVIKADTTQAQIKFVVSAEGIDDSHIVYDWEGGEITPAEFERHDYGKFILAQLRLDPDRVIEHTQNLSRTTAWRAMRKDTLADALSWAAQRARIDATVKTGQPADRDKVANILRQDPTLSNDLRVSYAKHLLAMTLALKEWEPANILPGIAAAHRDVAEAVFAQLRDSINGKQQKEALAIVEHWMTNVPEASALPWHQLWHLASWLELQERLQAKDYQSASEYIYALAEKKAVFKIDAVASQIILQTLKFAYESPQLAQALLILAATNVPSSGFQQLATDERLARQFPPPVQRAFAVLRQDPTVTGQLGAKQPEVLTQAVATIPSKYRPAVLGQMVEIALYLRKSELIDATVLIEILRLAQSEHAERYRQLINYLIEDYSDFERVRQLGPDGWVVLPQLYFMGGYIEEGIELIQLYQMNLFKADQKQPYINLVGDIFLKCVLPPKTINAALEGFENSRIWPDARVRAFTGALINQNWSAEMEQTARRLTTILFNSGELTRSINPDHILRLLQYHSERSNALDMLRTASAVVDMAINLGKDGPQLLIKAWQPLSYQPEVGQAAIELLRRYVRSIPPEQAVKLPDYFGSKLGKNVGEALEASLLVRTALGKDNFPEYTDDLQIALKLLTDLAVPYHPSKTNPPISRLRHDLDTMSGSISETERAFLADYLTKIAEMILDLGKVAGGRRRPSADWAQDKIVETLPENSVEFLLWIGARFEKESLDPLNLERQALSHIFGNRSINMLFDEINITFRVLSNLKLAYEKGAPTFSIEALNAEIDSLWEALSLYNQRQINSILAGQSWEMGLLLPYIAQNGNEKALQDRGIGKKLHQGKAQPSNEIEALRFISGYFAREHKR